MGSFALATAFGGEYKQDYLQPGSESKAADTLATASRSRPVTPSRSWSTPSGVASGGEARAERSSPTSPRTSRRGGRESFSTRAPPRSPRTVRRRTPTWPSTGPSTSSPRGSQGSNRCSPPATTPSRWRSVARSPGSPRRPRSDPRASGSSPRPSSCCSPSGRRWPWGCRWSRPCSVSAAPWPSGGSAPRGGRPGLGAGDRGHGRPRCRDRLRAAHRHPVPQQPGRGTGAATRDADGDRDRRTGRGPRRPHRARLHARHPAGGTGGPQRFRLHGVAGRAHHDGRLGDAAAGAPGLRRPQHRTPARALREQGPACRRREQRWYRWSRFIQRRPWVAALGGLAVLLALAAPFLGIRLGPRTPRTTRRRTPPTGPTTCWPTGSGPGSRRRCCSRSRAARTTACGRRRRVGDSLREVDGVAFVGPAVVNETGDTALLELVPSTSSGRGDRGRGRRAPRRGRPGGRRAPTSASTSGHGGREPRQHPRGRGPAASSSAACCWSRSCC